MLLSRGLLAALYAGICMVKSVAQLRKNLGERTCDDVGEQPYARRRAATVRRAAVVRDAAGLHRDGERPYAALPLYETPPVYAAIPS